MSTPIRLLSITKSTGGLAQYNSRFCDRLDSERFDVHVICLSEDNAAYADYLHRQGIRAIPMAMDRYSINPSADLMLAWEILQHVRDEKYDVLIGHGTKAGFLARIVGRLAGIPSIYRLASMAFVPRIQGRAAHLYRQLERLGTLAGGHIVTVARATCEELVRQRIAPADRITPIYTGIDLARFSLTISREEACRRLGLDQTRPVVGWAGRLVPQKAPLDFVRAVRRVIEAVPEVQIYMAGDGPMETDTRRLIAGLGLQDHIIRAPWQSDVPAMLSAFDVYVLSSHWEGLPQSLLEAMAMHCASVATAVDGTAEVIRDGVDGFLVDAGDERAMADRVVTLINDNSVRRHIRAAARQRVENVFTVEHMMAEWEALLTRVTERQPV